MARTVAAEPYDRYFADSASLAPLEDAVHVGDATSGEVLVSLAAVVDGVRLIDAITLP